MAATYQPHQQYQLTPSTPGYPQPITSDYPGFESATDTGERRRVRSVVLNEEFLGPQPEESVRYVEVPYIEEVVRHVPRREVVEVEKRVPKYEYEWVDRVVEIPQIQYVDRQVDVPQVHEVVRHVPRRQVVDVPKEVIRHVPKIETKIVEKVVEVPGEIIEVPKPYTVENKVNVPHHVDKEVPMIVAQTLKPILTETNDYIDVEVTQYEPEIFPVDIHVPRAVPSELVSVGIVQEEHRVVKVPPSQYNSMLRMLNPHLAETDAQSLPYVTAQNGAISFMAQSETVSNVRVPGNVVIQGWNPPAAQLSQRGSAHVHQHKTSTKHHHHTTSTHQSELDAPMHAMGGSMGGGMMHALNYRSGAPSERTAGTATTSQRRSDKKYGKSRRDRNVAPSDSQASTSVDDARASKRLSKKAQSAKKVSRGPC